MKKLAEHKVELATLVNQQFYTMTHHAYISSSSTGSFDGVSPLQVRNILQPIRTDNDEHPEDGEP